MSVQQNAANRGIVIWLGCVVAFILLMVMVGGITRLTESGLSMTTWEPVMGAIPPLNDADWQFRFDQYRASPEYQKLRAGMSLETFKFIFFWEYFHRLLGRLLGLVYALPLAWFWWRGRLSRFLKISLFIGLLLGGAQGAMGWYMVKSGLVDNPQVSHYRLAAHLGLAFFLFSYLLVIMVRIIRPSLPAGRASPRARTWAVALAILLIAQMAWGAFVAGLNAGFIYNTYPLMQGYVIAPHWDHLIPRWINFISNPITVQFIHRWLGAALLLAMAAAWLHMRRDETITGLRRMLLDYFSILLVLQFVLGVLTLIHMVPLALGVMHQIMACLLCGLTALILYTFHSAGSAKT